jgi:hypothetical protein
LPMLFLHGVKYTEDIYEDDNELEQAILLHGFQKAQRSIIQKHLPKVLSTMIVSFQEFWKEWD